MSEILQDGVKFSYVIPSDGVAAGWSADLPTAESVTQLGKVLRSEPDWHCAQDDNAGCVDTALRE